MAEVQTNTESGELTQRFMEFVMMQAQNAALFLGRVPTSHGEAPEVNLDVAKMFIDQLAMIRVKTKGNLSNEELAVLNNALSNLQMAFVEVSDEKRKGGSAPTRPIEPASAPAETAEPSAPAAESPAEPAAQPAAPDAGESRKKFTKSYGA